MRILLSVVIVLLATACERPDERPAPPPEPPVDPAPPPLAEPEPFDTVGVIEEARALERAADTEGEALTRLERTVPSDVPDGEPLRLALWEREGRPVRLEARSGEDDPVVYYFDERARLRLVRHPAGADVLDEEGRLLVRLGPEGEVRDAPDPAARIERAARLETDARQYLDEFVRAD